MKKYKVKYNNKKYIVKAGSVKDALSALAHIHKDIDDDINVYYWLKKGGVSGEVISNMSKEQKESKANEIRNKSQSEPATSTSGTNKKQGTSNTNSEQNNVVSISTKVKEYEKSLVHKYKVDVSKLPKPNKQLAMKGGEVLWGLIRSGADISIEDISNHPIVHETKIRLNKLRGPLFENDTININTEERKQLRKRIANTITQHGSIRKTKNENGRTVSTYSGPVDKNYRAEIVLGPPAGGKSSVIVDKVSSNTNSRVVDSDDIKKLLPEFDNGNGAGLVHTESADIILEQLVMPQFYKGGTKQGENLVIPIVGKNPRAALKYLTKLKEAGYKVHLSFNEVPASESAKRAASRFLEEGRFLDPDYIASVGNKPAQTYEYLKTFNDNGIQFDSYSKYNNNVKFGEPAKKLEHLDKDKNNVAWEDWQ